MTTYAINTVFPDGDYRLRGLTLHRPWPWAFTDADKRVENRPQRPPRGMIGQWVALHSGLHMDTDAALRMRGGHYGEAARTCPVTDTNCPPSVITCIAAVRGFFEVDIVHENGRDIFVHKDTRAPITDPWTFGPVAIDSPYIVKLPTSVVCRGAQGWWRLPEAVDTAVRAQVEIARVAHATVLP